MHGRVAAPVMDETEPVPMPTEDLVLRMQGIAKRALDGTAASPDAVDLGRKARPTGEQAWTLARSLGA